MSLCPDQKAFLAGADKAFGPVGFPGFAAVQKDFESAIAGLAEIGRYLGIGIANMIVLIAPDRVILGGGWSAAGDLIVEPIRTELQRRVRTTGLDEVRIVIAELGTWAGAIGAAVHGAAVLGAERARP